MKRFHVHLSVKNLEESVRFYTTMFGQEPVKLKEDYAKWMVEEPRVNFTISHGHSEPGIHHLGIQVDTADDLVEAEARFKQTQELMVESEQVHCCYASVEQTWGADPQGVIWEAFLTIGDAVVYCDGGLPVDELRRKVAEAESADLAAAE